MTSLGAPLQAAGHQHGFAPAPRPRHAAGPPAAAAAAAAAVAAATAAATAAAASGGHGSLPSSPALTAGSPEARPRAGARRASKPKLLGAKVRLKSGRYKGAVGSVIPGGNGYLRVMLDGHHPDLDEGFVHARSSLVEVISYGDVPAAASRKRGRPPSAAASPASLPSRAPQPAAAGPPASLHLPGPASASSTPMLRPAQDPDDARSDSSGLGARSYSAEELQFLLQAGALSTLPDQLRGSAMVGCRVLALRGEASGSVGVVESATRNGYYSVYFGGTRSHNKRRDEIGLFDEELEARTEEMLERRAERHAKRPRRDEDDRLAAQLLFTMATTPPLDALKQPPRPSSPGFAPLPGPSISTPYAASSRAAFLQAPPSAAAPRGVFSASAINAAALHAARDVVARAAAERAAAGLPTARTLAGHGHHLQQHQ